MDYKYVAYNQQRELVKGKVDASSEAIALDLLQYGGLRVLTLKGVTPFFRLGQLTSASIKPKEIVMFSRQLALLVESGIDIAAALDLLQEQLPNRNLRQAVNAIAADIRGGAKLSQAMEKYPQAFSSLYCRTMAIAEETGNLESALRQMADHVEKDAVTIQKTRSAFIYPIVIFVLAVGVIALLVTFVMPAFSKLYESMDVQLPLIARMLLSTVGFLRAYGWILLLVIVVLGVGGYVYSRTKVGSYQWDKLKLRLPLFGRIIILSELARCARTISTLFHAGVPMPEIMTLAINASANKVVARALTDVREELLQGQGLSHPMSRRPIFLPLIVQMAAVGENTGNLDNTMDTVAQSYEMEAADRTNALIATIQPVTTIIMGGIVGVIALVLVSTMYSIMGQVSLGG
jgi:type IV pilus assembly protein PilC